LKGGEFGSHLVGGNAILAFGTSKLIIMI